MKTRKLMERLLGRGVPDRLILFGARWTEYPGGSTVPAPPVGSPLPKESSGRLLRTVVLGRVIRELESVQLAEGTPLAYLDHPPRLGDLVELDSQVPLGFVAGKAMIRNIPMFVMEVLAVERPIPSGTLYPGEEGE